MATLVTDPGLEEKLLDERRRSGGDRHDEVWDGIYIMSPMANNEHQVLVSRLTVVLGSAIDFSGRGSVLAGVNVSDRETSWSENYRCPDVAVFLNGTRAENRGTHWYGGPDFAVEIMSPGDRTREKVEFYSRVSVRELLIVNRDPWMLELYRHDGTRLQSTETCVPNDGRAVASETVGFTFALSSGEIRPSIVMQPSEGGDARLI